MRLVFFFLFSPIYSFNQGYIDYLNITAEAEWHYDQGRHAQAGALLEHSFERVEVPLFKDVWMYMQIEMMSGHNRKAYKMLQKFLRKKQMPDKWGVRLLQSLCERDSICFTKFQRNKLSSYFIDSTSQEFMAKQLMVRAIDSMAVLDQKIRKYIGQNYDSCWWQNPTDSVFVSTRQKCHEIDSANTQRIAGLVASGQFILNDLLVGSQLGLLLLHMDYENFVQIEPELIRMIDHGNLDPWEFARAKDRKYTAAGHCIYYLVYPHKEVNFDCITYERILENRKSIGLSIYYSRPSFRFYLLPNTMMKVPMPEYVSVFRFGN